ncbi:hypothetical protein, partial [Ruminococcus sp.]|uniref:hypothetical protein n=1 Tax=Ruminococcus sp. TaxID=41978 RepID=UPI0025F6F5C0
AVGSDFPYFNPRLPCGRRQFAAVYIALTIFISIHTFLAEGDFRWQRIQELYKRFQSTPSSRKVTLYFIGIQIAEFDFNPRLPCGRRLLQGRLSDLTFLISIHAFRVEGDFLFTAFAL